MNNDEKTFQIAILLYLGLSFGLYDGDFTNSESGITFEKGLIMEEEWQVY